MKRTLFPLTPLSKIKKMFIECKLEELITRFSSDLIAIPPAMVEELQIQPRRSSRIEQLKNKSLTSPDSPSGSPNPHKIIYNPPTRLLFTPKTLESIIPQLEKDNKAIQDLLIEDEEEDPEYLEYDKDYGKTIETWFADSQPCPCCGSNFLRRYSSNIFPIIDLVCVNPGHKHDQVRFFQVKTSNGNLFRGDKYFNIDSTTNSGHIYTGSRKAGEPIHMISGQSSSKDKFFAIGYICISIEHFEPDYPNFSINKIDIVLPDLSRSGQYYFYVNNPSNKPKISWDPDNMIVRSYQDRVEVQRDYLSTHFYQIIDNLLIDSPLKIHSIDYVDE